MIFRRLSAVVLGLAITTTCPAGPYSPAAGRPGSDAIPYNDPSIVEWASGYENYIKGSPINNTYTNPNETLGPAKDTTTGVTELGVGGQITLTFADPILGTSGPDFAVFGNSFDSGYLKLAYVYVSQNGITWYEMPNDSLTPGPVGTYSESMDPTNIFGLAGKYVLGYGTPFSLSEVGLAWASYVKIVDVVGNGSDLDSEGRPIYDPYPNSDGFNVAGVAVLSEMVPTPTPEPSTILSATVVLVGSTVFALHKRRRCAR